MKILSINKMVSIPNIKTYLSSYTKDGYEIGFGKQGKYKGHSHYFFYDILFSPDFIFIGNEKLVNSYMAIIPPRTFMDDVEIGDFFFLKFCPSNHTFSVPEKTNDKLDEGKIKLIAENEKFHSTWFKNPLSSGDIWINANRNEIEINFNNKDKLKIIP